MRFIWSTPITLTTNNKCDKNERDVGEWRGRWSEVRDATESCIVRWKLIFNLSLRLLWIVLKCKSIFGAIFCDPVDITLFTTEIYWEIRTLNRAMQTLYPQIIPVPFFLLWLLLCVNILGKNCCCPDTANIWVWAKSARHIVPEGIEIFSC